MNPRKVLVIANPVAGRGRGGSAARDLVDHLRAAGVEVELFTTGGRGDARARAAQVRGDFDAIVSVGGDGTLSEVLEGLPRRTLPVGQLPLGTANVLARDLSLPRDPRELAGVVARGRTQALDVARVAGRLCFLGTSAGYDAQVVHGLERIRRGPITRMTWARAALGAFARYTPPVLSIEVDGRLQSGTFGMVILSNVVNYAGWPTLAADRVLDDGRFEAYLFPARSRLGLLRHALRGLFARFPGGGVVRVSGKRFRVAATTPLAVQVDGDAAGTAPFELVVEAEPCRILVP